MWSTNSPHPHGLSRFGDHNYCRNTAGGSDPRVWCYTTDPNTRWDFCDVPQCGKVSILTDTLVNFIKA